MCGIALLAFISIIKYMPEKDTTNETKEVVAIKENDEIYLEKNSALNLETFYTCGHTKKETLSADDNIAGKTKSEIEDIHPDWKIESFDSDFISVKINSNEDCGNHYVIKLKDDTLFVYKKANPNEVIKQQKINTSMLLQEEISDLENGINAETEFEVLEILESFVS